MSVPRLVKNVARGTFTPWSARGRYVSLFEYMPGRELGVFEIRPRHARMVGTFAAELHRATKTFSRRRDNEFSLENLEKKVARLERALEKRRLAKRYAPDVARLASELRRQSRRSFAHLPHGTVHGDLFVDNAKFLDDELVGVIDFEMASSDRLLWDVAVTLNDWCWQPSARQMGGPAGRYPRRARALLPARLRSTATHSPPRSGARCRTSSSSPPRGSRSRGSWTSS